MWVRAADVARRPGHVFYERLNGLLSEAGFDEFVEELTAPFYAVGGRPGIAPGVYFRMLFVGYFEGVDSQRGIAWRCEDSLSLRKFLGLSLTDSGAIVKCCGLMLIQAAFSWRVPSMNCFP